MKIQRSAIVVVFAGLFALGIGVWTSNGWKSDAVTLNGEKLSWDSDDGQWKVINFFAPWCSPCLREIPALNILHYKNSSAFRIYGVSYDPADRQQLKALVDELAIQYPVIVLDDSTVLPMPTPPYLPATYIVSPKGKVVQSLFGEQDAQSLQALLDEATATSASSEAL